MLAPGPANERPTAISTPRGYSERMSTLTYTVPAMHCGNCTAAVEREVSLVAGVDLVEAELSTKQVVVRGEFDDDAVRAAIKEAGYEAE